MVNDFEERLIENTSASESSAEKQAEVIGK